MKEEFKKILSEDPEKFKEVHYYELKAKELKRKGRLKESRLAYEKAAEMARKIGDNFMENQFLKKAREVYQGG